MCYSTMVMDDLRHAPLDDQVFSANTAMGTFRFAQSPQGVVPALLAELAELRKAAKKDMAAAKASGDEWSAALANGRQLAMKITMNRCGRGVRGSAEARGGGDLVCPVPAAVSTASWGPPGACCPSSPSPPA